MPFSNPPASTLTAVFKAWWQSVSDRLNAFEAGTVDVLVPDEAYDATNWNGSLEVPTKNAVRDKIESLSGVSDTAYDATTWNGVTGTAPSKNAVRDKIEDILDGVTFTGDVSVPDEAYGVGWNGSLEVPTKNAIFDKIENTSALIPWGTADSLFSVSTDSGSQTITTGSTVKLTDSGALDDPDSATTWAHWDSTNDRIVMDAGGWFMCNAEVDSEAVAAPITGNQRIVVQVDQAGPLYEMRSQWSPFVSDDALSLVEGLVYLEAGWHITLFVLQVSGESADVYNALLQLRKVAEL